MEKGYLLRKFHFDKLKSTVSISNYKKTVFNYILANTTKVPGNWKVTMVTKQKIFEQLYLLWDLQGWNYTSQDFQGPTSRELWDNKEGRPDLPPPLPGIRCGSKILGIRRINKFKFSIDRRFQKCIIFVKVFRGNSENSTFILTCIVWSFWGWTWKNCYQAKFGIIGSSTSCSIIYPKSAKICLGQKIRAKSIFGQFHQVFILAKRKFWSRGWVRKPF